MEMPGEQWKYLGVVCLPRDKPRRRRRRRLPLICANYLSLEKRSFHENSARARGERCADEAGAMCCGVEQSDPGDLRNLLV